MGVHRAPPQHECAGIGGSLLIAMNTGGSATSLHLAVESLQINAIHEIDLLLVPH